MTVELARRAVACPGWRWAPGMLTNTGYRVCDDSRTWPQLQRGDTLKSGLHFPDLSDDATRGCLLALVRDAHRDAYMAAGNDGPAWVVRDCDGYEVCRGTSERAVLVAALEAAL